MAETNPGQQNIAFDATTNQPRLTVDTTYDDDTSLDDIKSKYTDIGDQYNRFVQDARQNVADRQTEHIGNNFGASPYNTNTYYEPAASSFSSAMRQQGTQQAFEVGMERGRKEAEDALTAAKNAYNNAATAYNNAYDNYQQSKSSPTAAYVDKSLLPDDVNEDEVAKWVASSGSAAEGLTRAIDAYGINAGVTDWDVRAFRDTATDATLSQFGKDRNWYNTASEDEKKAFWADAEVGRFWSDTYAKTFYQNNYGDDYTTRWQTTYDQIRRLTSNLMGLRGGELSWSSIIVPEQDLPDNMSVGTGFTYIDIISPEFNTPSKSAEEHVERRADGYYIDGEKQDYEAVRQKVAEFYGTTVEALDAQAGSKLNPENQLTQEGVLQDYTSTLTPGKWNPTNKEVWAAFSGGELEYTGYTEFSISADNVAEAVLGVDIKEAKALARMAAENPEGYERLTDQIARAYTDATVFEVADGNKAYFTKDGYKVLDAGTVVMNIPDAVTDENGDVIDEDLKRMIQLYSERDDPTMSEDKLMDEYEKAWTNYFTRLAWAMAVTNQTDGTVDKDIYAALLYSQDKSKYKDIKIGDKTAEELLNEFRGKCETNPEDAYREFTGLWEEAYQNLEYFFVKDSNGNYTQTQLYDTEGDSMVGRYGEDNKQGVGSNRAMALIALYANSMDAYNAGSKDGNINPNFLEADGADDWTTGWTELGMRIKGSANSIAGGAVGAGIGAAVGSVAPGVGTAVAGTVGDLIGSTIGTIIDVVSNNAVDAEKGDFGYDMMRNNKSSELLRNAVNPLSLSLWGLDDNAPEKFGASYEAIRGFGDGVRNFLVFGGEVAVSALASGAASAAGSAISSTLKNGVSSAARKLLTAGAQQSISSIAGRAAVQDLMDPSDEIMDTVLRRGGAALANQSDDVTEAVANKYIKNAAKTAVEEGADDLLDTAADVASDAAKESTKSGAKRSLANALSTVPSLDQLDDYSRALVSSLNSTANESTNLFMKAVSYLANNVDDYSKFGIKFSEAATQFITKESVKTSLTQAGFKNLSDEALDVAVKYVKDSLQSVGAVSARQTYQVALISGFTGMVPETVAMAGSDALTYLSKMVGQLYDGSSAAKGIWKSVANGTMTKQDVQKAFASILETSAKAVATGQSYGADDIVRDLIRNGWKERRALTLLTNKVFGKNELYEDVLRDIRDGYTVPVMNDDGTLSQTTVEDYFSKGGFINTLVNNLVMAGVQGVTGRVKSAVLNKSLDRAYRALSATEQFSPDYATRYAKVQKLQVKAEKLANKMLDENLSYSKMKDVADKGYQYIEDANKSLFDGLTKELDAVDKNFSLKNRAEQAEFLKKRFNAPDAVAQAYVNAQTDAFISYPYFKKLLGGDSTGTLATLEERGIIGKIWKAMADTADEYRTSIKENKRFKTVWDKQAEMRRLQKKAVMEALRGADGTHAVQNLESAIDSWFNMIDDVAKKNVANGVIGEDQVRLGYLPISGMLIGQPGDGVPAAARGLWLGDSAGNAMAISSADPAMSRAINVQDLINAYINGDKVARYTNAKGEVIEVEFNPQGFQFLDAAITYRNSNTFHRTVGAILGGDSETTGSAAMKSGWVQLHGENLSKAAANADKKTVSAQISEMETAAKAKMTEDLKAKDLKAKKRAEKALSNIARQEESVLKRMGEARISATEIRAKIDGLRAVINDGARPKGVPTVKEWLGIENDSDADALLKNAREQVQADIKRVQAGEKLESYKYEGPTKIISGAQTGVDTIGLEVANKLGYETGGTTTPGFVREAGIDKHTKETLSKLGVQEISEELQGGKSGKEFYLPRTEQNVINSDATVYFANDADKAGLMATRRFAEQHRKPFLLNPTAEELSKWLGDNKVSTLNVAGNRGSKLGSLDAQNILETALDKKQFGTEVTAIVDRTYKEMIEAAARNNGHFNYDVVARRMLLDANVGSEKALKATASTLGEASFTGQGSGVNLTWNKAEKRYTESTIRELSSLDLDKGNTRDLVNTELSRIAAQNSEIASERGLKDQYMRVLQDAFSQAKTIMDDQIKVGDNIKVDAPDGGFAHGFYTYLDIVDRLLPDKELYETAVNSKLVNKLNNLGRNGITLSDLKESVLGKIATEKAAGNDIDDLVTTYKVLDLADAAGTRATGIGDYTPEKVAGVTFGDESEDALPALMREGVTNIYGMTVDSTNAYDSAFDPAEILSQKVSPDHIDYTKMSSKDKSIYDMVSSKLDLDNREDMKKALDTTAKTLNKLTNNGSKLYDTNLKDLQDSTVKIFSTANELREEINKAVKELAKTDNETKSLIDAEAARRAARQKSFGKHSTASATYDGSAALGVARPGSAVLYSENPARYNAIAASLKDGKGGLASDVVSMRGMGIADAESILAYMRDGREGLEELDSLVNFDAGSPAGIYHQLRHAALYLNEKGVDTTAIGKKLNEMKTELGGRINTYGDIYGNFNPPEYSLAAALAEVEGKQSFFPENINSGVDRIRSLVNAKAKNVSKWGETEHPNFMIEYTAGGESTDPGSVISPVKSDGSDSENILLHLVDDDGEPVDISQVTNENLLKRFDGMTLYGSGPDGENIYIFREGQNLRAEYELDRGGGEVNKDFSRTTPKDEKWMEYLASTAEQPSSDDITAYIQKLERKAERLDNQAAKLSKQRAQYTDEAGNIKTKSVKTLVEESQDVNYKKYMSADDYEKYTRLKTNLSQIDDYLNGKTDIYHALSGATYNGDAPGYSNMVKMSDFLETYGYKPGQKELDTSKLDAKSMKKQLRSGNLKAKKNWGKPEIDATALPSTMDKKSAELTVANLLGFAKEVVNASGMEYIDFDQMWVDRSYLELLARYADTPNKPTGLMNLASKVSAMPNFIQQQQLAGGWGPINALTLANVRSAILEDPTKAIAFAKMLTDFRNSKTALYSILDRSDLLARVAMATGDGSIVTDLYPVMSKRAGRDDGGVLQTFAAKILDRTDKERTINRFPKGFRENIKADLEDFFENPTFQQAMPVMRAQMISMNYDSALSTLRKKFGDQIGKEFAAQEIEDAAMMVAYTKTQKFFTPQKYWSGDMNAGLAKIKNQNLRKMVGQITGEGTPTTVLDVASSAFFALRYKQTFVNRFVQGVKSFSNVPSMLKNQLSSSATLEDVTQDLTNVGQMKGIASLIGIAVLAKVWCDAMGIPNAWDDFDFTPEGDEVFHMPSVLMKFQNSGQIWLPNDTREDGSPYVNPNKMAYKIDPFFSMFTLPNSAMRAINTTFNGSTDSYKAPQRGLPFIGSNNPINQMLNSNVGRAVSDELIGSNLLSPFKAVHEIITNSTYFGNNIWERKYLPDGKENPNYDPGRNAASSVMHLLGLDSVLDPNGYNRWVKGGDDMVRQDQVGTISGSGILQHEYASAAIALMSGDLWGAVTEAGELPIKTQKLSSNARTEMNTVVKNTLDHYGDDYRAKIAKATSVDQKDEIYAEYVKKCADEVARWSAKHNYLLGENQELVASATRMLMAMTSGEYDDNMAYVQNAYWKASQIAQIESGTNLFLKDGDLDDWLANGGTVESFTEEKNRRSQAYNQALDEEWEARKALIDAGYNPEYLAGSSYEDLRAEQRSVSKKIYESIMSKFEKPVGEFKNYKELKAYYEEMIANASTTKQKVRYASQYNSYVTDIISEAIASYGPAVLTEATYNGQGITNQISDYIIIPADKYYTGKSPRSSYLKDLFGVGYRNKTNLPSDDELLEKWDTVKWLVSHGKPASASTVLDTIVKNIKNGRWYASDVDYSDIIKLKSRLRSKQ